jgi:tetratricopeptide (TPR) repeat protein
LTFLSVIAFQFNEPHLVIDLTAKALEVDPMSAGSHLMHGHAQSQLRRWEDALASYDRAIALQPEFADGYFYRGNVLCEIGRHQAAVASYDEALRFKPDGAEIHNNRGLALFELKQHEAALASYDRAVASNPRYVEAYFSRGNVLRELKQLEAALVSYDQAIAMKPGYALAYSNRANVLSELLRFDAALASYEAAIDIEPGYVDAYCNRGNLLADMRRFDDALRDFNRAIAIDPQYAQAYFSRSLVSLLLGDLVNGWRDFEWRWKNEHCATSKEKRNFARPLWLGEQSLRGKTILLHSEQGLGDTIQFCRYSKLVAGLGARVILEVPRALANLLASLQGVAALVIRGEPLPLFDYYCPLMSLPLAFKTTLAGVPAEVPYLRADEGRKRYWSGRLGKRTDLLRVGLVWSGGFRPNQPELWSVNQRRNIPLAKLAELKQPGIEFYSLQKGRPAEAELSDLVAKHWNGPDLVNHTSDLFDFADTAALIEQLDLVITVDTSMAHLAGALGKPVWILNRFDTCWRWLLDRTDSPWYPTARLYRQQRPGEWEGVVDVIRRDLQQMREMGALVGHASSIGGKSACDGSAYHRIEIFD